MPARSASRRVHYGLATPSCGRGGPTPSLSTDWRDVNCGACAETRRVAPVIGSRFEELLDEHVAPYMPRGREGKIGYLRIWQRWAALHDLDPLAPSRVDLDRYRGHLVSRGLAAGGVNSHLTALRVFFDWMEVEGHLERNPARHLKLLPKPRSSPRAWLPLPELADLLDAADRSGDVEMRAYVYLLAYTGVRSGDAIRARVPDFSWRIIGRAAERRQRLVLLLQRRKDGSVDRIPIADAAVPAVLAAVADRRSGRLLINHRTGLPLNPSIARKRFAKLVAAAGVPEISAAGLRVGWITNSLAAGIPERDVMYGAGHSSTSQTAYYDRARVLLEATATDRHAAEVESARARI